MYIGLVDDNIWTWVGTLREVDVTMPGSKTTLHATTKRPLCDERGMSIVTDMTFSLANIRQPAKVNAIVISFAYI